MFRLLTLLGLAVALVGAVESNKAAKLVGFGNKAFFNSDGGDESARDRKGFRNSSTGLSGFDRSDNDVVEVASKNGKKLNDGRVTHSRRSFGKSSRPIASGTFCG